MRKIFFIRTRLLKWPNSAQSNCLRSSLKKKSRGREACVTLSFQERWFHAWLSKFQEIIFLVRFKLMSTIVMSVITQGFCDGRPYYKRGTVLTDFQRIRHEIKIGNYLYIFTDLVWLQPLYKGSTEVRSFLTSFLSTVEPAKIRQNVFFLFQRATEDQATENKYFPNDLQEPPWSNITFETETGTSI